MPIFTIDDPIRMQIITARLQRSRVILNSYIHANIRVIYITGIQINIIDAAKKSCFSISTILGYD